MRVCALCDSPSGRLKYCSIQCKSKAANSKKYKRPPRACPGCGLDVTDRHGRVKYCSNTCRRWVANGHTELRSPAAACRHCGSPIVGKLAQAIFCTRKCKLAASERRRVRDDHARYLKERARRIAYAIEYAKANPDIGQITKRRRKALVAKAGMFVVSASDWRKLVNRYGGCCFYCGVKARMTMDHVVPISRGGTHSIGNLLPACASCNARKKHRTIMEWRLKRRVPLAA